MRAAISFCLALRSLRQRLEPGGGLADRHVRDLADVLAGDLDRQRFRLEAIAPAGRAGRRDM
jgi:hypothetical protein